MYDTSQWDIDSSGIDASLFDDVAHHKKKINEDRATPSITETDAGADGKRIASSLMEDKEITDEQRLNLVLFMGSKLDGVKADDGISNAFKKKPSMIHEIDSKTQTVFFKSILSS